MRPILVRLVPCLVLAALAAAPAVAAEPSIQALIEQLRNERCDYSSQAPEPCVVVEREGSWLQWLTSRFHAEYECPLGAARCLEALGPRARAAVPALIEVLREGPNDYDTGDGVIPTRSAIAAALGAIGDPRAIGPLAEALTKAVPADRADTATVSAEPAARQAIIEALGRFGPAAAAHAGAVAAVLRARNADRTYVERRRAAFEQQQAVKIAIEEIQAEQPDRSRFSVPPSRVAKAAKKIDRTTADYLRNFEQNARDPLASAAALALGAFGETSATPVLTDALRNVAAAEAAAAALGELRAAGALDALQQLLASGKSGPAARATAARALGRIGRAESVRPLARGLADPELADACAEALADFGPRAKAALPALQELVARPSQAERSEARLVYSAEASRLMRARIAAVRAIESAAGARAFDLLAPYALDPEIGGTVRHALARLDAVRASELAGSAP